MKNFLLIICLLIMSCTGCSKQEKGCMTVEPKTEEPQILAYAKADSLQVTKHGSGMYYQIINAGSGETVSANSKINISYVGKFLNGSIFDQGSNENKESWDLSALIEGWQIGLSLIKKGGRIKLIIPSAYAYGCNGKGSIPPNTILFFDVTLINVQ